MRTALPSPSRIRILAAALVAALGLAASGPAWAAANAEGDATVALLQELIRLDTSNAPGDTRPVAAKLKALFDAAGIENEIILAPNGKAAHFIARLRGDGSKRPVLLAAHTDVVPADKAEWSVDPFGGVVKDGYVWGRGALDNKGAVAAFTRAMLRLKTEKVRLARDVIFLAEADEEQGQFNTSWLAAHHWDRIDAEFALNEGGRILQTEGKVTSLTVSYADKQTLNLKFRATGQSGHSSRPLPLDQTANGQLLTALTRLTAYETDIVLTPETRTYLDALAQERPGSAFARRLQQLLAARTQPDLKAAARVAVVADDSGTWGLEGLLRNTLVLTMINAGVKPNVIPGSAEALFNARLLPGQDPFAFIAQLKEVIDNPRIEIEVVSSQPKDKVVQYLMDRANIAPSSLDTDLYRAIGSGARATWPGVKVAPTLLVASTDATPWRQRGVPVYGISPFPIEPEQASGVHGKDERVAVQAIHEGGAFVYRLVRGVAAKGAR